VTATTGFSVDGEGRRIGPVAQHLLLENDAVKVWQVDTPPGETFWHHYHDHDYVLFHTSEMLGVVYKAEEDHDRIWRARMERGAHGAAELLGAICYEHSLLYIPGTGFLSPGYVNIGETRFTAALIEVKRPRRADQEGVGFSRTDALVGLPPRPGSTLLLENDRLRVYETVLDPGEADAPRARGDCAAFVIDGGRVRTVAVGDAAEERLVAEEERPSVSGYWMSGDDTTRLVNVGDVAYRELAVELK
jgi:hypothetical protein